MTRQIEVALEEGYADYVFFPDMGHSHLYFPKDHWEANYPQGIIKLEFHHEQYEKMFADTKMRPLYHLSEKLQFTNKNDKSITDPILNFKFWHRNFLGKNDGSISYDIEVSTDNNKYNTVKNVDGYNDWSAGFAISSSKDGCFPYRDKEGVTRYFDISLKDPGIDPNKKIIDVY